MLPPTHQSPASPTLAALFFWHGKNLENNSLMNTNPVCHTKQECRNLGMCRDDMAGCPETQGWRIVGNSFKYAPSCFRMIKQSSAFINMNSAVRTRHLSFLSTPCSLCPYAILFVAEEHTHTHTHTTHLHTPLHPTTRLHTPLHHLLSHTLTIQCKQLVTLTLLSPGWRQVVRETSSEWGEEQQQRSVSSWRQQEAQEDPARGSWR